MGYVCRKGYEKAVVCIGCDKWMCFGGPIVVYKGVTCVDVLNEAVVEGWGDVDSLYKIKSPVY